VLDKIEKLIIMQKNKWDSTLLANNIMILGASGWISHYLIDSINALHPEQQICGVYRSNKPKQNIKTEKINNSEYSKIFHLISEIRPHMVINFTRGETDTDFNLHLELVKYLSQKGIYYVYSSSSNATDAIWDNPYTELSVGNGKSDYGKFKAKCEKALIDYSNNYVAFRFAATHGYAPNRISRTELFLQKLYAEEVVPVNLGIFQNRTYISDLTNMMAALIIKRAQGIIHLGSIDQSEEFEFLSKLASLFGYIDQVFPVEREENAYVSTLPLKMFDYLDSSYKFQEQDTFDKLIRVPEFQKYKKRI